MRLTAGRTYRQGSEHLLTSSIPISKLSVYEGELRAHLLRAQDHLSGNRRRQAFLKGEAICHAGLMWRYGHDWCSGDPLVAVDSEVRIGFRHRGEEHAVNATLRQRLGLRSGSLPNKLDALGVLPTGDLVLVEVKDAMGSIERAVVQIAVHMARFSRLMSGGPRLDKVQAMLDQKRDVGVIPWECPRLGEAPRIVPWIAAPDDSDDWPMGWTEAIYSCDENLSPFLSNLRLVRLSTCGSILDEAIR